jgi:hypothetical protein
MAVPWLRILDMLIGVSDFARGSRGRPAPDAETQQLAPGSRALGHLETRLAGVVVAALREAFDRDTRRLELEREQVEAERMRVERALRLELLRQAGEREIGRLRLVAGVAVASWLGTLFFATRLVGGGAGPKAAVAGGWLLLIAALATAFVAQSRVAQALDRVDRVDRVDDSMTQTGAVASGLPGTLAPWLVVAGLTAIGFAILIV